MTLRCEVGRKVQQPRNDIAIEEPSRDQKRWVGQDKEKAGGEKKRQVLEVIQLDSPDALDALNRLELLWVGLRIEGRLPDVFRRAEATLNLHHAKDGQPGHAHGL